MKLIKLFLCAISLTSSQIPPKYQSLIDLFILPLNYKELDESDYQLYIKIKCPYALDIEEDLIEYINRTQYASWYVALANDYFPSPTLRVKMNEGYINYRGLKEVKDALNTIKS